jgi:uncharacterized repeat protein (TIGR03803 family)
MKLNHKFACGLFLFVAAAFSQLPAQNLNVLYNFPASSGSDGRNPSLELLQGSDGNFYGMTTAGGANNLGTVYKITPAGSLTTLVSFTGTTGAFLGSNPHYVLAQGSDGNIYGTTAAGGSSNLGTIFKMTPAGAFTTLVSFNGANGDAPRGLVQGSDGNFYGVTFSGGSTYVSPTNPGDGTVFVMTPAGSLTTLVSFDGVHNGRGPAGTMIQGSDGNFYDSTMFGLNGNTFGTVFSITPAGVLTTVATFTGTTGVYPHGGLVQGSDGNFYGTTSGNGTTISATVFQMTPAGSLTTLVTFTGPNGIVPRSRMVQGSDGNFYGSTQFGGSTYGGTSTPGDGTIYKMTPAGALTTLVSCNGFKGSQPFGGLVLGSDGNFYGTAQFGGDASAGVFFQLNLSQQPVPALPRWGEVALALGLFVIFAAFLRRVAKN